MIYIHFDIYCHRKALPRVVKRPVHGQERLELGFEFTQTGLRLAGSKIETDGEMELNERSLRFQITCWNLRKSFSPEARRVREV